MIIYDVYRFLTGYVDGTMFRFLIRSVIFFPVLILFFGKIKEFLLVYADYKKLEKETKTVYIKNQGTQFCIDKSNGAYKSYYCSESFNGDNIEYWIYKKSLDYHDAIIGQQYKITYYKNSKCVCNIEPISDNINFNKEKSKTKKSVMYQKTKELKKQYAIKVSTTENSNINKNQKVVTERITTLGIPFNTEMEDYIIAGIPYSIYSAKSNNQKFFLKVRNEKGKKINLILKSIDILGLGNLEERPGYLGYGNFIGAKYEVEYYKVSHIIKDMKLISLCDQSGDKTGDGSVSRSEKS